MSASTEMSTVNNFKLGLVCFGSVLIIATCGYMIAGWSFIDAIYMVIITVFGVGFGEVNPLETTSMRTFTMFVIIAGTTAEVFTLGGLIQMLTQGEIRKLMGARRMRTEIDNLTGHVIICGYGRIGQVLADELVDTDYRFVIVDNSSERIAMAQESGYLAMQGNASEEESLLAAGIKRASVLATVLPNDAINVFITLTARNLNSDLSIIARGEIATTHKKLVQAGANQVVLPTMIGAQRVASLIRRPVLDDVLHDAMGRHQLDEDLSRLGVRLQELPIPELSPVVGKTIGDIEVHSEGACLIVGLRHSHGTTISNPSPDTLLAQGDTILVIGHADQLPRFIQKNMHSQKKHYQTGAR